MLEGGVSIDSALDRGVAYLLRWQSEAGSLRGDYDGPLFLTPGYVFACYATRTPISTTCRSALIDYLDRVSNEDGGFGLHLEGPSLMFTTVLNYVAIRLLGGSSPGALQWIRDRGGAVAVPSWGKAWLAVLGLYDWEGMHPLPPELWLLPRWVPIHPRRFWCHTRVIYLALSYLYGARWRIPEDPLIGAIRREIFDGEPHWRRARSTIYPVDLHVPRSRALRGVHGLLSLLEPRWPRRLRARALARVLDAVEHEESTTAFIALGPVNKALNAVVLKAAGSPVAQRTIDGLHQYLFDGERGVTMQAYNSSELWDTALATQALAAAGRTNGFADGARRFVSPCQISEDVPAGSRYHRGPVRGGWPFSTRPQGWPTADCTAEGLVAGLTLGGMSREQVTVAVDLLLWWQNRDGGWPTYERQRGGTWLEALNSSELFADVMVDHSFVELTASAMHALVAARPVLGGYRAVDIEPALERGGQFLRSRQRPDGSWEGSWGICFTYGTWFGVRGLRALGAGPEDPALDRASRFLVAHQLPDGGWGESYESCTRRTYLHHPSGSQAVMTAWALLALVDAATPGTEGAVKRGIGFLLNSQLADGDWPQHAVTGVFNRTCMLNYRFYRNVFPIWALARAAF